MRRANPSAIVPDVSRLSIGRLISWEADSAALSISYWDAVKRKHQELVADATEDSDDENDGDSAISVSAEPSDDDGVQEDGNTLTPERKRQREATSNTRREEGVGEAEQRAAYRERRRASYASSLRVFTEEHEAYCDWLRLCSVPSRYDRKGRELNSLRDDSMWMKTNDALRRVAEMHKVRTAGVSQFFITPERYQAALSEAQSLRPQTRDADDGETTEDSRDARRKRRQARRPQPTESASASRAHETLSRMMQMMVPPQFGALAPNRTAERLLHWWLREETTESAYSSTRHDESFVRDHVVPQIWMRPAQSLAEFTTLTYDPNNIMAVASYENLSKGDKALNFGNRARDADALYWSLRSASREKKAMAARAVAYVALTYPFVTASRAVLSSGRDTPGMPLYLRQIELITELLKQPPSEYELAKAYVIWALTNWTNPLVLEKSCRNEVATAGTPLNALLRSRLAGEDMGSQEVLNALHRAGVSFQQR